MYKIILAVKIIQITIKLVTRISVKSTAVKMQSFINKII